MTDGVVLIVDDDRVFANLVRDILATSGYCVVVETVAARAVDHALNTPNLRLAIVDINIDRTGDGIGVAEQIARRARVPILFLSADTEPDVLNRAARVSPHLATKGLSPTLLIREIAAILLHSAN